MVEKPSLGLKNRFYLYFSFIGRLFLEKMHSEKSPKNGQISPKCKEVNLNFLTILDHFGDFLKWLNKRSWRLYKRFYLVLSFIGRTFLEKIDFEKSPKHGKISPKSNFLTILDQFLRFF